MEKWLLLSGLLGLTACQPTPLGHQQAPITNGQSGGPAAVGLIVELGTSVPTLRCTGTLIAPDAVLTAAHCILDELPQRLGFVASHSLSALDPAELVAARELHPHPLFVGLDSAPVGVGQANDVGVMLLASDLATAVLPLAGSSVELAVGDRVSLSGAGWTFEGGTVDGEISQGQATLTEVGDFELESGQVGEAQACPGDSGGAVVADGRLAAVISRTSDPLKPCEVGSVSTRVDSYLDFIELFVALPCGSGDQPACGARDGGSTSGDAAPGQDASGINPGGGSGGTLVPRGDDGGCGVAGAPPLALSLGFWLLVLVTALRRRRRG